MFRDKSKKNPVESAVDTVFDVFLPAKKKENGMGKKVMKAVGVMAAAIGVAIALSEKKPKP